MTCHIHPLHNREGQIVTMTTRSGRTIEGIYLGVATGHHVIDASTDVTGKVIVKTFVDFEAVDVITVTDVAQPATLGPPAPVRGEYR